MSYPINFTWTGVDGTVWPFKRLGEQSLTSPLRIKPPGIKGLVGAGFDHDDDQNVDQAGVTWRALMRKPNVISIPVLFGPVTPGQLALDKWWDFRDSFGDGRQLGEFHIVSKRKDVTRDRFQAARLLGQFPDVDDMRVSSHGYLDVGEVQVRSDESWWRQAPVDVSFTPAQFAGATVPNVSDDDAWAYWEILGPITNPTIGVAGESITLVITVPAGQTWRINTDPNNFLVRDGANVDRSFLRNYWRKRAPRKTAASLNNGTTDIPVALGGTATNSNTRIRLILPQVYRAAL